MDQARLQVQDITGAWITVGSTALVDQLISGRLNYYASTFKKLVRAVDKDNNILQIKVGD